MFQGAFSGYSSNDIDNSKEFYKEILGLDISEGMDGFNFSINGQQIFIYPKSDHVPAKFTVLNFIVEDIDGAIDTLVGRGVIFERYDNLPASQDGKGVLRGKDACYGPNIAWFKDPSGNILALVEQ